MHGDIAVKNGRKGSLAGLRKAAPHMHATKDCAM